MTVSGAPVFISLLGVSTVLAQPPDTEDPASGAAHDGHKFGAWLFPVEKLNYVLAHWVQLGGEFRSRFEGEEGIRYTTTDDNYLLTRLRFNLTIQPLKRLTFFGGMEDSRVFFNQQVPDAVPYQSAFDIRQAYVQAGSSKEGWTDIIVGRQVLVFGNERVIGPSDWINVGHTFDAVCFDVHQSGYRLSLFASSVVVGVDGSMDHLVGNNLYGVYGSLKNAVPEG
ncbi:MAG: hypothetical protein QOJ99_4071, partial [Bryobacterales bacterium]|nr:hypothetical protein [Bryobacterales bacterium]